LRGIQIAEIVDGEKGDEIAGERPDEFAQLPSRRARVRNAITGTRLSALVIGVRVEARWWALGITTPPV
jgi:hypothetical protein